MLWHLWLKCPELGLGSLLILTANGFKTPFFCFHQLPSPRFCYWTTPTQGSSHLRLRRCSFVNNTEMSKWPFLTRFQGRWYVYKESFTGTGWLSFIKSSRGRQKSHYLLRSKVGEELGSEWWVLQSEDFWLLTTLTVEQRVSPCWSLRELLYRSPYPAQSLVTGRWCMTVADETSAGSIAGMASMGHAYVKCKFQTAKNIHT